MTLSEELLHEAIAVLGYDHHRAGQAALRRSVSTSYYAVFHLLVDAASHLLIASPGRETLRAAVRRTFVHARMADACNAFTRGKHKLSRLLSASPSPELVKISKAFVYLQESRHRADYDTAAEYTWTDAALAHSVAEEVFINWSKIHETEDAQVFLVALLLWKDLHDLTTQER